MNQQTRAEYVVQFESDGAHHERPLTDERLVIGRAVECDLCFPRNPEVSRRHAALALTADGCQIEDLGSRAGTLVNGQRIDAPRRLCDRDRVSIGQITLTLRQKKLQVETVADGAQTQLDAAALAEARRLAGSGEPATPPADRAAGGQA